MAPYTGPDAVPGALDYMSFSTALYGESDLWTLCRQASWLGTTSLPALTTATSPDCSCTTLLSYYAHFCMSLALSFCHYPLSPPLLLLLLLLLPPLQPLHCSLILCLRCICFPRNAAALQVYKEGERKMFVSVFIFLSSLFFFFFIRWIKLTYFIILNKKRYFSSPDWKYETKIVIKKNCYTFSSYSLFTAGIMSFIDLPSHTAAVGLIQRNVLQFQ